MKDRTGVLLQVLVVSCVYMVWRCGAGFFLRDEWELLAAFRHWSVAGTLNTFHGQFIPLFKLFYRAEVAAFGVDGAYYLLVNVAVLAGLGLFFFRLASGAWGRLAAFGATMFLLMNPNQHELATWAFQVGVGLHLACAVAAVLFLMDHLRSGRKVSLAWSLCAMVAQNYFFSNGMLMPLLYIGAALLWKMERLQKRRLILLGAALSVLFIAVQLAVGSGAPPLGWRRLLEVLGTVGTFTGVNTVRLLFFTEKPFGAWAGPAGMLILMAVLAWGMRRHVLQWPHLLFGLLWLLLSSISVPLARMEHIQAIGKWGAYYSSLAFPPLVWLVFPCLWAALERVMRKGAALRIAVVAAVLGWVFTAFMVDAQLVNMVAVRSVRNEARMNAAVRTGVPYQAFDDPYFTAKKPRVPDAVAIYRYWSAQGDFKVPGMKPYPNDLPVDR